MTSLLNGVRCKVKGLKVCKRVCLQELGFEVEVGLSELLLVRFEIFVVIKFLFHLFIVCLK